jgi:hypothetical protein
VGDFDCSGEDIEREWMERTGCLSASSRVLLTYDQVRAYELPTTEGKAWRPPVARLRGHASNDADIGLPCSRRLGLVRRPPARCSRLTRGRAGSLGQRRSGGSLRGLHLVASACRRRARRTVG